MKPKDQMMPFAISMLAAYVPFFIWMGIAAYRELKLRKLNHLKGMKK